MPRESAKTVKNLSTEDLGLCGMQTHRCKDAGITGGKADAVFTGGDVDAGGQDARQAAAKGTLED
jgi:hypothetical protein